MWLKGAVILRVGSWCQEAPFLLCGGHGKRVEYILELEASLPCPLFLPPFASPLQYQSSSLAEGEESSRHERYSRGSQEEVINLNYMVEHWIIWSSGLGYASFFLRLLEGTFQPEEAFERCFDYWSAKLNPNIIWIVVKHVCCSLLPKPSGQPGVCTAAISFTFTGYDRSHPIMLLGKVIFTKKKKKSAEISAYWSEKPIVLVRGRWDASFPHAATPLNLSSALKVQHVHCLVLGLPCSSTNAPQPWFVAAPATLILNLLPPLSFSSPPACNLWDST